MRKQEYTEQERKRRYYFFDYLFWLGEITWENYHKVNFKQPRGSDMLWACITLFIFMPALTIAGHFLDDLAFEVFGVILVIVFSVSVIMTDRLFGKIYPPSRRKAVMQHYAGCKFSPLRRNLFFSPPLFADYSRNGFIRNCSEMDNRNTEMTNKRNILGRFFRVLVMLHKIPYAHFTEWNNKRKRKAFAAGIYFLSIIPEFVLLAGTFLAARGQDGYVHLVNVPQKIVVYGLAGLAVLLSAIPLGFFDDKKICKEVRQELRERPRYWRRALAVYWTVIVAIVVVVNAIYPLLTP